MSIELGKFNTLKVVKEVDFGMYLDGGEEGEILLPSRYVPEDCKPGDELTVFIYLDNEERLVATTLTPFVQVGQFACLEVAWINQYGAFLNWGLMKDLFVPFREQKMKMQVGKQYVIHAHLDDESYRIVASAKVDRYLSKEKAPYEPGQEVNILIWQKTDLGFKAIIENRYSGLLYESEIFQPLHTGMTLKAYVKQVREENIRQIKEKLEERYAEEHEDWLPLIDDAVYKFQKKTVRKMILKDHKRPDGRAINEIRPLAAEIDLLPRVHGSGMFTRGQTQIMTITTLAPLSEAQKIDGLDANITSKRYMHHYNFPSYSVGETKPSRGPGRREIGHGALAERALVPVLPSEDEFPYAIRTVSETLESNGSTSQASICASTLSLMAAGVPIKKPVAGISTGLVTGDSDDDYIVLTDIQGLEDFFGDMDFKVAGTHDGITAIQMDIKIHGLTPDIIREAISRTKEAREHILTDVMEPVISTPRDHVGEYAPKIMQMHVDPDKISEIIGKQGKTINAIIDETGVKIDINDEGRVDICGVDQAMIDRAMEIIRLIVEPVEAGKIYEGEVVRIMNFGAFVQLAPNKDGLIHISKLSKERVEKVEDVVNIGDKVKVKVLEIDKMGRINLALREIIK